VQKKTVPTPETLSLTVPSGTAVGSYNVVGTLTDGGVTMTNIQNQALIICNGAAITGQPGSATACSGATVNFALTATGTSLTHQWKKGGVNVPDGGAVSGATTATLTINPVNSGHAGTYTCTVSSPCGPTSVTSSGATLTVPATTVIAANPSNRTVCQGASASFSVTADGASLSYQWRKNGINISGATSATYAIGSVVPADAGSYDCVVNGTCGGTKTSDAAALTVQTPPAITVHPGNQFPCSGGTAVFSVTATGSSLTYQWKRNGVIVVDTPTISGSTTATLTLTSVGAVTRVPTP